MASSFYLDELNERSTLLRAALDEAQLDFNEKFPVFKQLEDCHLKQAELYLEEKNIETTLVEADGYPVQQQKLADIKAEVEALVQDEKAYLAQIKTIEHDKAVVEAQRELQELRENYSAIVKAQAKIHTDQEAKAFAEHVAHAAEAKIAVETHEKVNAVSESYERLHKHYPEELALSLSWIPPLRVALGGMFGFVELYHLMIDKIEPNYIKVAKAGLIVAGIALSIAMLLNPISVGVILFAALMGSGATKDSLSYYAAREQVKKAETLYQTRERALTLLNETQQRNPKKSYQARIKYRAFELQRQKTRVKKLNEHNRSHGKTFLFALGSFAGALMCLFPPTLLIGGILLVGMAATAIVDKTGIVGKCWRGLKSLGSKIKKAMTPPVLTKDEVLQEKIEESLDAEKFQSQAGLVGGTEKDIIQELESERAHSKEELHSLSQQAAKGIIDNLEEETKPHPSKAASSTPVNDSNVLPLKDYQDKKKLQNDEDEGEGEGEKGPRLLR